MNRTASFEYYEQQWGDFFGYPAYQEQSKIFKTLENHLDGKCPLILEAPTGTGKSSIGLFLGKLAIDHKKGKIMYICSTTNLQTQLLNDASKIKDLENSTIVLFGKWQYYCVLIETGVQDDLRRRLSEFFFPGRDGRRDFGARERVFA